MTSRGWFGAAIFVLCGVELILRALIPVLAKDETFNSIMSSSFTGGTILVASYYFGSSKDGTPK